MSHDRARSPWWHDAVFYQVYPRSFCDSDGDGVGDLQGIIQRLDHLNGAGPGSLGVDAIWLSPIYPSPLADFGYDVSDYTDIDPVYGDLHAFDRLVAAAHRRGIRVLIDFVLNHTSTAHPWFSASRSAQTSDKRDWYVWRDPRSGGGPPNNWRSVFGGPAWTLDARTGQYYLHSYLPSQPDLNWYQPRVAAALAEAMRFWLRRGVDGFRLDALGRVAKPPGLPDNPINPRPARGGAEPLSAREGGYLHPSGRRIVRRIRRVMEEFPDRVAIGEVYAPVADLLPLYAPPRLDGVHMVFDFELLRPLPYGPFVPWSAEAISAAVAAVEGALPAGARVCWALGNHDVPRLRSRYDGDGDGDGDGGRRARAVPLLLLALPGAPCLYAGDEIGMVEGRIPAERRVDPVGRDGARTPMQWDRSPGRGFTGGVPWLPFGPREIDVDSQRDDPASMLSLYREAIRRRRAEPSLRRGRVADLRAGAGVVRFVREAPGARPILVALNDRAHAVPVPVPARFEQVVLASVAGVSVGPPRAGERCLRLPSLAAVWLA